MRRDAAETNTEEHAAETRQRSGEPDGAVVLTTGLRVLEGRVEERVRVVSNMLLTLQEAR